MVLYGTADHCASGVKKIRRSAALANRMRKLASHMSWPRRSTNALADFCAHRGGIAEFNDTCRCLAAEVSASVRRAAWKTPAAPLTGLNGTSGLFIFPLVGHTAKILLYVLCLPRANGIMKRGHACLPTTSGLCSAPTRLSLRQKPRRQPRASMHGHHPNPMGMRAFHGIDGLHRTAVHLLAAWGSAFGRRWPGPTGRCGTQCGFGVQLGKEQL